MRDRPRSRSLIRALTALACVTALGPRPDARQERIAHVYVTVIDKGGKPVAGLTAKDFTVSENGIAQRIVGVAPATEPLSVALLLDRFGLTSGNPTGSLPFGIQDIRQTLLTVVRELRQAGPDTQMGLWTFDGASIERFTLAADTRDLETFISKMTPIGSAPVLLDGLSDACDALAHAPSRRRAIFALIAGYKFDQSNPLIMTPAMLDRSNASLWALEGRASFPVPELGNSNHSNAEPWLTIGIKYSGGLFDAVSVGTALEGQGKRLAELIVSQYLVDFAEPAPSAHALDIRASPSGSKVLAPARPNWISR